MTKPKSDISGVSRPETDKALPKSDAENKSDNLREPREVTVEECDGKAIVFCHSIWMGDEPIRTDYIEKSAYELLRKRCSEYEHENNRYKILIAIADELITNENAKKDWEDAKNLRHN